MIKTHRNFALLSLYCGGAEKDDKPTKQLSKRGTSAAEMEWDGVLQWRGEQGMMFISMGAEEGSEGGIRGAKVCRARRSKP